MSEQIDCVIVGAGVVGLAVARSLAQSGRDVIVLERNAGIGEETSSRNSEVIHAGIYYPTASLKARLCVIGKVMLYEYCQRRNVAFNPCGKLIVATDRDQLGHLDSVAAQARRNGVGDLEHVDETELRRREPEIAGVAALWSPSTGILDSHGLMLSLQGDIEAANGMVVTRSEIGTIRVTNEAIHLEVRSGSASNELTAKTVVNSAGLEAIPIARRCTGLPLHDIPEGFLAKGSYFMYQGHAPFSSLIYPLPEPGGLGIHATLDLSGRLRFGPDVEWIEAIDYEVDAGRRERFAESIRRYWPTIQESQLVPGYAGIRPKLAGPGEPPGDFRIDVAATGQSRQLVHLFGIESPGLTAALAIAEEVRNRIESAAA